MRFFRPIIVIAVITAGAFGFLKETDPHRTADRAPASEARPVPSDSTSQFVPAPAAAPVAQGESLWPNAGDRWIYRFERKASAEFGGKPWLKLAIGGRAALEATDSSGLATHGGNRFYLLSLEVDRLQMQGESRNETRSFPSVRIEVDAAGKLRELRFVAGRDGVSKVTEEEADLVRDLASQWLFFEDRSRMGVAEVEWTTDGAPGPVGRKRTVTKRVVRYAGRPEISKLDSSHEWATGADEGSGVKVDRIEGTENFTVRSPSGDFAQSTSYRWLWTSTEKVGALRALALGDSFTIDGISAGREASAETKVDPARVAREWAKLAELAPHARLKLFRDAKKALDGGANELVSLIVGGLKGKSASSIEWRTGVGALASSSNPEAAAALHSLFREPGRTAEEKLSILSGVAAGEGAPAPQWKETFEAALEAAPANARVAPKVPDEKTAATFDPSRDFDPEAAVREASLYALGSSIRKETDGGRRAELEGVLWHEVKEATTERAQTAVLEAIGNSGSGDYYSYVKDQAKAASAHVRAKAVAAVRFLASDLAKPIIDAGKADPVPAVRKVAEWSAKFQSAATSDAE
jgi:hypothetical protein